MGREKMSEKLMPLTVVPILAQPTSLEQAVTLKWAFLDLAARIRRQAEEDPSVKAVKAQLSEVKKERDALYEERSPDFFDADEKYKSVRKALINAKKPYTLRIRVARQLARHFEEAEKDFITIPTLSEEDLKGAAEALRNQRKLKK